MKTINLTDSRPAFQGDLMIRRIAAIPAGAERDTSKDAAIVAHSETGHHHLMTGALDVYRPKSDQMVAYIEARSAIDLVHLREFDTHETLRFEGGKTDAPAIFECRRQREHTPEGWRRVED